MKARVNRRQHPRMYAPALLSVLRHYRKRWLSADVVAGLSACIVMIPSVIAYAELVHLPPITGLYAALAAALGYATFASSRQVIAGPDAAICLLVGAAILPLGGGDTVRLATLAAELGLLTGAVLLLAAWLKLGVIADLLSRPVLTGYLNGASLILIATQLGKMLGVSSPADSFFPILRDLWTQLKYTHWPTLLTGILLMALMVVLNRKAPRIPGALVACGAALFASVGLDLGHHGVALVAAVPTGLPHLGFPDIYWEDISALAPAAVAVAFLAFSDGLLLAQAFAEKHKYEVNPNQELVALSSANILASFWQGFPVSASQSRTSIVDQAGGNSQVAQLVAAGGLVIFLIFLTGLIPLLPKVALGSVLIITAIGMLEIAPLRRLYTIDPKEFWLAISVTAAILLAGVVTGIIVGMLFSLAATLVQISRPRDAVLRRRTTDGKFHDCLENEDAQSVSGVIVYRLYAPLIFANARYVVSRIRELVSESDDKLQWLVLDAQAISYMDVTAAQRISELHRELDDLGVEIKIADAPRPFREQLAAVGLSEELGNAQFFVSVKKAVEAFESRTQLARIEFLGV
ncbi:MAG: SulP family inorganic anion transporter [Comamonadaceae bacterium]